MLKQKWKHRRIQRKKSTRNGNYISKCKFFLLFKHEGILEFWSGLCKLFNCHMRVCAMGIKRILPFQEFEKYLGKRSFGVKSFVLDFLCRPEMTVDNSAIERASLNPVGMIESWIDEGQVVVLIQCRLRWLL